MSSKDEDSPKAGLTESETRRIVRDELSNSDEEASGGRREFLQALGLGGLAAGVGGGTGYAARSAIEPATASSHNDSTGDVGTPSDPVDVFAAGISADELLGTYPGKVRAIANDNVVSSIDPANTTTPVADAISDIHAVADGGTIWLPPTPIEEASTLTGFSGISIKGQALTTGPTDNTKVMSEITFTSSGATSDHGLNIDLSCNFSSFENVILRGPGQGLTTGDGVHFSGTVNSFDMDRVFIFDWSAEGIHCASGAPYQMDWGYVSVANCDGTPFKWEGGGAPNHWRYAKLNGSGSNLVADFSRGSWNIGTMNIGGQIAGGGTGQAIHLHGANRDIYNIGVINFEPSSDTGWSGTVPLRLDSDAAFNLGYMRQSGVTSDYLVQFNVTPRQKHIGELVDGGTLNQNHIELADTPGGPITYGGRAVDVDNTANSQDSRLWCLGSGRPADPYNTGTATLTAGGTAKIGSGTRKTGDWSVDWGIASDPNAAVSVNQYVTWDDTNNLQRVVFEETSGTSGVDIDYVIY